VHLCFCCSIILPRIGVRNNRRVGLKWCFNMAKIWTFNRFKGRRSACGSQMAEFSITLFVLMFFCVFPMINLLAYGFCTGSASFIGSQIASNVAVSDSFDKALAAIKAEATTLNQSGIAKFANLTPAGGYQNCGFDLYTVVTSLGPSGAVTVYGPTSSAPKPYDTSANTYEFMVRANYQYKPFCNLASVPFIGSVPGVGANVNITNTSYRCVESPTSTLVTTLPVVLSSGGGGPTTPPLPGPPSPSAGNPPAQ